MTTLLPRGRFEKKTSRKNPRNPRSRIWKSEKSLLNLLKPICSKPSSSLWRRWQLSPLYICCAIKFRSYKIRTWLPTPKDNISGLDVSKILKLLGDFSYHQSVKKELEVLVD